MVNKVGFWTMVVGLVVTAIPILIDEATVLYTFYPPLEANALFYIGLVLVVVGSWIEGYGFYFTYRAWRKDNPDTRTPFVSFAAVLTMVLWQFATLGVGDFVSTRPYPTALQVSGFADRIVWNG